MRTFVWLARYAGMREDWVQAGGGNVSVKRADGTMAIKSSGFAMSDIDETHGWSLVDAGRVRAVLEAPSSTEADGKAVIEEACHEGARPSIETFLHAATARYTLHIHPLSANVLLATPDAEERVQAMFPDAVFVPYATPGWQLARRYAEAMQDINATETCPVIFLQNHGVVVSAATAEEVVRTMRETLAKIETALGLTELAAPYDALSAIYDVTRRIPTLAQKIVYRAEHADIRTALAAHPDGLWEYQFCPDCLVYCGRRPLVLPEGFTEETFQAHLAQYGLPVLVRYRGELYILADSVRKAHDIESVAAFSARVAEATGGKLALLSENEQRFLLHWDAERYRQKV